MTEGKNMHIQLKQSEIETAVRQYVASQGINLANKSLSIAFSATRGEAGIIANLTLEDMADVQIPGFTDRPADAPKSATVVTLAAAPNTVGAAITGATTDQDIAKAMAEVERDTDIGKPEVRATNADPVLTETTVPVENVPVEGAAAKTGESLFS